jgi:hypothetical protein
VRTPRSPSARSRASRSSPPLFTRSNRTTLHRVGVVVVRGKGDRREQVPLPVDVGELLAAYLQRARPTAGAHRHVFLALDAPHRPLGARGGSSIAARTMARAGIAGPGAAHRLQHTAACRVLAVVVVWWRQGSCCVTPAPPRPPSTPNSDLAALVVLASPVADGREPMNVDLRAAAADYLRTRRARGYRLAEHEWLIAAFLDRLAAHGATMITLADALAFAPDKPNTQRHWQATRLRAIQAFAAHVHAVDPAAAELIPAGLITAKVARRIPYLQHPVPARLRGARRPADPRPAARGDHEGPRWRDFSGRCGGSSWWSSRPAAAPPIWPSSTGCSPPGVEVVYHRRVHSETGERPIDRFATGGAVVLPAPALLHEAFLWSETRMVTKTATVSLHGNAYEVDAALVGRRVELVFDPFDLTDIEVRFQARSMGKAVPVRIGRHVHPQARRDAAPPPVPTGIDYLGLIAQRRAADTRRRPHRLRRAVVIRRRRRAP